MPSISQLRFYLVHLGADPFRGAKQPLVVSWFLSEGVTVSQGRGLGVHPSDSLSPFGIASFAHLQNISSMSIPCTSYSNAGTERTKFC
jgi:hypothetical protein